MSKTWISCAERQPDEGVIVDTAIIDHSGTYAQQNMMRQGKLWYFRDWTIRGSANKVKYLLSWNWTDGTPAWGTDLMPAHKPTHWRSL